MQMHEGTPKMSGNFAVFKHLDRLRFTEKVRVDIFFNKELSEGLLS